MTTPDKSLPVHQVHQVPAQISLDFDQILQMGEVSAKSRFFGDIREAPQAVVKILAGRELGLPAMASIRGLQIIKGQITISAHTIAALVRRSGIYDYRITTHTPDICEIEFTRGGQPIGTSTYTMADARKAKLVKSDSAWDAHPKNMLYARAMSNGAKWFCPDLFLGAIYADDEFGPRSTESPEDESGPIPNPVLVQPDPPSGNGTTARAELLATPEQLTGLRKLYEQLPDRSLWPGYMAKYGVKNARDLRAVDAAELIEHLAGVRGQVDQLEADIAGGGVPEDAGTKS